MKQVREIVAKFEVSRPIFRLTLHEERSLILNRSDVPEFNFTPETVPDCVVTELVNSMYTESFSIHLRSYAIDLRDIENNAISSIRSKIRTFIIKNLETKNPSQTKIYKWAQRNMPPDDEFNEVILSLYKYLRTFCDDDMVAYRDKKLETDNIMALLDAMQEKYDKR